MKYWYQSPPAALSDYIRTVLVVEGFPEQEENPLPLFTNGMPALVCRTEKKGNVYTEIKQLVLFGRSTPPGYWSINEQTTVIAYFFKPFSIAPLFNLEAVGLAKEPLELANWNPHKTNALKIQLTDAGTSDQKTSIIDHFLLQHFETRKREMEIVRYATDAIMNDSSTEIFPIILKTLNITERTFQRTFKKFVGISPVQYRKICQFQSSFDQLRTEGFDKLTDVAFDNGFADQSHFNRSFKEFTKTTPGNYLKSGLDKKE